MQVDKNRIGDHNQSLLKEHQRKLDFAVADMQHIEMVIQKLIDFNVAIPSWALGTGGTRFGRFSGSGEPRSLEDKLEDVGEPGVASLAELLQLLVGSGSDHLHRYASALQVRNQAVTGDAAFLGGAEDNHVAFAARLSAIFGGAPYGGPQVRTIRPLGGVAQGRFQSLGVTGEQGRFRIVGRI